MRPLSTVEHGRVAWLAVIFLVSRGGSLCLPTACHQEQINIVSHLPATGIA